MFSLNRETMRYFWESQFYAYPPLDPVFVVLKENKVISLFTAYFLNLINNFLFRKLIFLED